eukprot:gene6543-7044_t
MSRYYQADDEETKSLIHPHEFLTPSADINVVNEEHSIQSTSFDQNNTSIQKRVAYFLILWISFCLSFYFVFLEIEMILFKGNSTLSRRLDEATETTVADTPEATAVDAPTCTWKDGAIVTATGVVGAAVGAAVVLGGFALIGLTPAGPVAGGWFASNMGAGLVSGSWMSLTQSAAMTGTAYGTGAAVGAVSSAFAACKIIS